jgi:anti-sigma-K factor RskA
MKPGEHDWRIAWIAAAIAIAAALYLAFNIAEKQGVLTVSQTQTLKAVEQAGALVTPTDPNQYP